MINNNQRNHRYGVNITPKPVANINKSANTAKLTRLNNTFECDIFTGISFVDDDIKNSLRFPIKITNNGVENIHSI
jgi:hypothetical protein